MARSPLPAGDRARGALLGLALGHAAGLARPHAPAEPPVPFHRMDTSDSPHGDAVARALILGDALLTEPVDLEQVAYGWSEWFRRDGRAVTPAGRRVLDHLVRFNAPLREGPGDSSPIAICLPVALAAWGTPGSLVTGTYHTALLADPDPAGAWAAVAVNVAIAQFFAGRRDFVGDVIGALQANDADPEVLSVARRVPLLRREDLDLDAADASAVRCLEAALWAAYHVGSWERAMQWVALPGQPAGIAGGVIGALLGARDGERAIPPAWMQELPDPQGIRELAKRLVAPPETRGAAANA